MFVYLANDWNVLQTSFCYVMEVMEGGTLRNMLREMNRLPEPAARFYAAEIILAVNFLYKRGIVHR
jgi:protein kinase A